MSALQSSGQESRHNVEERVTHRARVTASKVRLQIWALEADRCVAATVLLANQDIFWTREVHMELMARCPLVPSRATVVGWRLSVIPVVVATEATQAKHDWEKNVSTK